MILGRPLLPSTLPAWLVVFVLAMGPAEPTLAGPPYQSDDPEPTPEGRFEIYSFTSGSATRTDFGGQGGIDFNYGGAPDLQLTATLPLGFAHAAGSATKTGLANIALAAKCRFLHQDDVGVDIAVFPRVFLPSGSSTVGDNHPSLLLPIWLGRDWGDGWSAFGGGGCVLNSVRARNFCLAGGVVTRQVTEKLQLGVEFFHQTADSNGTPASSSLGIGGTYDLDDRYHLLGYVSHGIENASQTGMYGWYAAILFTF